MPLSDFGRMLSVGTIPFEDRFCASKKGGMGEVGGHSHRIYCLGSFLTQMGTETTPLPFLTQSTPEYEQVLRKGGAFISC